MVYKPIGINGLIDFHHNHNPSLESHFASGDSPLLYNESNTFLKFDNQFNTLGTAEFGGHIQIKIVSYICLQMNEQSDYVEILLYKRKLVKFYIVMEK